MKYQHVDQLSDENKVYYIVGRKRNIEFFETFKEWSTAKEGYVMGTRKNPLENGSHRNVILGENSDIGMILTMKCIAGPAIMLPSKPLEYECLNNMTI